MRFMLTVYAETPVEMRMVEKVLDALSTGQTVLAGEGTYQLLKPNGLDRDVSWDPEDENKL